MRIVSDDLKRQPLHEALMFAIRLHDYAVCVTLHAPPDGGEPEQVIGEIKHITYSGVVILNGQESRLVPWELVDQVVIP